MLWEKKLQLEKETQAALNPEHGQNEIRGTLTDDLVASVNATPCLCCNATLHAIALIYLFHQRFARKCTAWN